MIVIFINDGCCRARWMENSVLPRIPVCLFVGTSVSAVCTYTGECSEHFTDSTKKKS